MINSDPIRQYSILFLMIAVVSVIFSCTSEEAKRFTLLSADITGVNFENMVMDTPEFNILNYLYFYDGGGVATGDINNDGLPDLFLVGNEVKNRLYLNEGGYRFEDITVHAGVGGESGSWSTGATMADVNGDGFLDIYVSRVNYLNKSGANQLFINNGDRTFTERASEYGLDFVGYSTQAVFFDYNNNGRLDLFLLNHSFHSDQTYGNVADLRDKPDPHAGDKLFRNDGGSFTDVTGEAGIYSSALGYGLGVAVSDINKNGWLDIYVGNDFHEDDYLYLNNGDGTFTEALYSSVGHTSASSMGNDIADINNDGYADIVSVDMMPEDHETFMRSGGPDLYQLYQAKKEHGYGDKNARNTLQFHRGNDSEGQPLFSEIAFASGVAKTDWSWASLFMDLNNSGHKDLFVTNGIVRRSNDLDFLRNFYEKMDEGEEMRAQLEHVTEEMMGLIETIPKARVPNYAFQNNGDLTFTNKADEWGLAQPGYSSGAAYADLNNDGHLDLIVNNVNMPAFIYRNNALDGDSLNYLKVKLNGQDMNTSGIGSKVIVYHGDEIFYQEQMPTRGFQSSVDHTLHVGLGDITRADSLLIVWPDHRYQTIHQVEANQLLQLNQEQASGSFDYSRLHRGQNEAHFKKVTDDINLEYTHRENDFNDFRREPLMPYKLSTQGPALAVGDVSGDGFDDIYIGGGTGQSGKLFLQQSTGSFRSLSSNEDIFAVDQDREDVDAIFFDANNDGHSDLYVVSGGGEFTGTDTGLIDRLYINQGNGEFRKSEDRLPEMYVNGSVVRAADFNNDGSVDLFVGGRSIPFRYGESPRSFLLANDGNGFFRDVTEEIAPALMKIGMVTDAQWAYISNEQYPDLVVVGEWMPIHLFQNSGDSLENKTEVFGLTNSSGLWQSVVIDDINNDGLPDMIAGNFGTNSRIQTSIETPLKLYVNDFIGSGQSAPVIAKYKTGNYYPFEQLDEMILQFRSGQEASYKEYATQTIVDLFGRGPVESSLIKEIKVLESSIFMNNGNGTFSKKELPIEAQISPVMAIKTIVNDSSGFKNILLAGNIHEVKPSMGGRQDASYGLQIRMDENYTFKMVDFQSGGFLLHGEVRSIKQILTNNGNLIIVARNDDPVQLFRLNNKP